MKSILTLMITICLNNLLFAQLIVESKVLKDNIFTTIEGNIYAITISSKKVDLKIELSNVNGSASNSDYEITNNVSGGIELKSSNSYKYDLLLKITKDQFDEKTESFDLKLTYEVNKSKIDTLFKVQIDENENSGSIEVSKPKIMFLNGYNFDFGATSTSNKYVGHLNFFAPSLKIFNDTKWGFNTGIMKINYAQNDSNINERHYLEYVAVDPYEEFNTGSKYIRQYNSYRTEKKNTVWSFYVQPLYELTEKQHANHIYVHGHFELLATKWSSKTIITTIYQAKDTMIAGNPVPYVKKISNNTSTYNLNSLFGYFGAGLTFHFAPWDGGEFFFQPTIGKTTNYPQPSAIDIESVLKDPKPIGEIFEWSDFYLIRAYYHHSINDKATLVIGTDIRGLFPPYAPQYAAYVGINLSLDTINELINPSKK